MADFYLSSVAYTAVVQWAALTTLAVGAIRRQLAAPATNSERCFRVSAITTGITGAAEPAWTLTSNGVTTDAGVTWTECTGQSNHQHDNGVTTTWTAPAARINSLNSQGKNVLAAGDRIFVSSDHAETQAGSTGGTATITNPGTATSPIIIMSVNRTSTNIPPLLADYTIGAKWTFSGAFVHTLDGACSIYGVTWADGGTVTFNSSNTGPHLLQDCTIDISTSTATQIIDHGNNTKVRLTNTPIIFGGSTSNRIRVQQGSRFEWQNTPNALQGSNLPTNLFNGSSNNTSSIALINGVDLSALGAGKNLVVATSGDQTLFRFANCKIGAVTAVYSTPGTTNTQTVEIINCDGTVNYRNEKHHTSGDMTTDATTYRVGGASDTVTPIGWKLVSLARANPFTMPFEPLPIFLRNALTGVPMTITIQIVSSASLGINDFWIDVEYLSDASSPLSSFVTSRGNTPLSTNSAITTSTATWNSPPATPVYQQVAVTFTPQQKGNIVIYPKLGLASKTMWLDPAPQIS